MWARTNKFGHVFDETGKMIGEVERVSDDAQAENTSKTLAAAGHKLINCNNDALKVNYRTGRCCVVIMLTVV